MALILSIETSASACSVAIHSSGKLISDELINEPQAHASKLSLLINQTAKKAGIQIKDLQAIAVSSGPGSYTGLRIGTSTAKGICLAVDLPLIGIPTLELLANAVALDEQHRDALLCPMIDAKRMEVYFQIFNFERKPTGPVLTKDIDAGSFHELLNGQPVLFFGDGAEKCKTVVRHENALFMDLVPKAQLMGELAFKKFQEKSFEDLISFVPFYLKQFVAKKATPFF